MISSISAKIKTDWANPQKREQYKNRGIIGCAALVGAGSQVKYCLKDYNERLEHVDRQYKVYQKVKENPEIYKFRQDMLIRVSDRGVRVARELPSATSNAVMFISNSKDYAEHVIDWLMAKSMSRYIKMDTEKMDLLDVLEACEGTKEPNKWTFVYAKNMENMIDRSKSDDSIVESMKDIMTSCAEDFHSTLLFSTDNPEKLDKIALQQHRVNESFDLRGIKESDFFQFKISDREHEKLLKMKSRLKKDRFKIFAKPMALGAIVAGTIGAGVNYLYRSIKNANKQHNQ